MIALRFEELAQITNGALLNGAHGTSGFRGVSIDSRTIGDGQLFIAIRGENHDGHAFISQARRAGAVGVMAGRAFNEGTASETDFPTVVVDDSHLAMIDMARDYRHSIGAQWIGITGTNGKTTTKELAWQIVREVETECWRSPGNFNNLFGIPLSILSMPATTRVALLEMGISRSGEMKQLADIVRPDMVVITNVGPSHLEYLGSVEKVAEEKLQLVRGARATSPIIFNGDDMLLKQKILKLRPDAISFGLAPGSNIVPDEVTTNADGTTRVILDGNEFRLSLFGKYQVYNLLAAYSVFVTLGYTAEAIDTRSLNLNTAPMRGQVISINGVTFISDCYNANPDSVMSALETFSEARPPGRKIAIIGDMLELGESEIKFHRLIGQRLADLAFDLTLLVGPRCKVMAEAARSAGLASTKLQYFERADNLIDEIKSLLKKNDSVYVKGSRGVGLERVIDAYDLSGGDG